MLIYDAKYHFNSADRLDHSEFAALARWTETFDLRSRMPIALNFGSLSDLAGNCLVTNGQYSTETVNELLSVNLREIANFYPGITHTCRP